MGIPDHLTCLLRNLYAGQEATVRTGHGALGRPRGMVWGGRREEGSGWGTHVNLWRIHFDIWQNYYNYVKFKNKIKLKKKKNWTWNNRLVPNWKRSMSRLHIVALLI